METNKTSHRIHPLVAAAAVAVLLVSLTGVAAMTGLLPSSRGSNRPTSDFSDSPSREDAAAKTLNLDSQTLGAIPKSDSHTPAPVREHADTDVQSHQAANVCHTCGKVESIQEIKQPAKTSGVGVVAGAVIGGVLGNQIGAGNGRALSTVAGAVGGGFAGNEVEKRTHTTTVYQVRVRMADGHMRTFTQHSQQGWRVGDRVKVVNGTLTAEG
jgi:outer membrane lipoprotein SlyB